MPKDHVMLDLETLGVYEGCAVLSVGATLFDAFNVDSMETPNYFNPPADYFYVNIDLQSSLDHGMKVEGGAFYFWMQQISFARDALRIPEPLSFPESMIHFENWISKHDVKYVWGHGSGFDCTIFRNTYRRVMSKDPWPVKCERDTRTLFDIAFGKNIPWPEDTPFKHVALYDAWTQAILVKLAFHKIQNGEISDLIMNRLLEEVELTDAEIKQGTTDESSEEIPADV